MYLWGGGYGKASIRARVIKKRSGISLDMLRTTAKSPLNHSLLSLKILGFLREFYSKCSLHGLKSKKKKLIDQNRSGGSEQKEGL